MRRSAESTTFASLWVFPGGTIRTDDLKLAEHEEHTSLSAAAAHLALARTPDVPPEAPEESLAYFVCAARELFEEAGVLLTRPLPAASQLADLRTRVQSGLSLATAAEELGAALALDELTFYGHWITPLPAPARFDTRFFLALLPEGQEATPDAHEVLDGQWLSPDQALAEGRAGRLPLHFATLNHLKRLGPYPTCGELLAFARAKPIAPVLPNWREENGRIIPSLPLELQDAW
ncbi:MAG TPA: hypothetical protein VGK54_04515 [Chloroflexota bacterium]